MWPIIRKIILAAMLFLVMAGGMGCGKKGPPLPPLALMPSAPVNIRYQLKSDQVILQWKLDSESLKKGTQNNMGVEIYRARRALSQDTCNGCPLTFEKRKDLPASTRTYAESLEKGFRYFYRLRTTLGLNIVSAYSETIEFDFE